jgi:hypothetical protein
MPRFNYNPTNLSLEPTLLAEPSRTNLLTYSQDMSNAAWTKYTAADGNQTTYSFNDATKAAPDGTNTSTKITKIGTFPLRARHNITLTNGVEYWVSCWVYYPSGADTAITFDDDTVTASQPLVASPNWQRKTFQFNKTTGAAYLDLGFLTSSPVWIWGVQVEQGTSATSYIPTTSAAVTRALETVVSHGFDLGAVSKASLDYTIKFTTLDTINTMSTWVPLASAIPLSIVSDKAHVKLQIATSTDGSTFGAWEDAILSDYVFRTALFRLVLETEAPTITPRVSLASITIDMEDRIANGYDVVCPSGGLRVTFAPNFMASPSVHIDGQGLVTGDYHRVTSRDATGFNIQFFNSAGTGKSVTFDWIAKGYGYKQ